jgi:hypothetical protein
MPAKTQRVLKALQCPICGHQAVFYVTHDAVRNATQFPVPFQVVHKDHTFTVYLDSGLLISRIQPGENNDQPTPAKKQQPAPSRQKQKS